MERRDGKRMFTIGSLDWIVIAAYMLGMVAIGLFAGRKLKGYEDHILSGRQVPTHYLAPGLLTTQIGAGSIIGFVGLSYSIGYSGGWWIISNIVTFIVLGLIGAKPLREAIGSKTLPEWFGNRYNEKSRLFTSITIAIAEIAFTTGQIVGGGLLFSVLLGWDPKIGIFAFSIIVVTYTVLGGLWAVFITDFVQMFVMFAGVTALIAVGVMDTGGITNLIKTSPEGYFTLVKDGQISTVIAQILYAIPAIFCSFDIIQKIMSAKSPQVARNSCYWAAGGVVFFAITMPLIGILGYHILGPNVENPEMITPLLIGTILPIGLKGLAISAVLATLMSSASACLIAASAVITNDICKYFVNFEKLEEKRKLSINIWLTLFLGVISWAIASFYDKAMGNMELAWTALSCGAFIPLIAGLLWKKASSAGAISSMLTGALTGMIWLFNDNPLGWRPIIPAYIVGILVLVLVSVLFPNKTGNYVGSRNQEDLVG
ncbi:sodium:solute symporter family protein [Brevibacillus fluminis]|uniref:Sodium:solute symporter family protein n=2 Tax=Brevibacillus fluminis TaxID=511487 RepID=A0A3M8CZS9_9BACL|nr:sodium:solute symporter family protein [Brevibacillus fluminis]